jgi:uncharacterized Rmd1/YagE family protein
MSSEIYKFVAVSFKEDFEFAKLSTEWKSNTFIADPKDIRIKKTSTGTIFIYSFGVLTFVNISSVERTAEIAELSRCMGLSLDARITSEEFFVEISPDEKPRVEYTKLVLNELTPEREAVIAQILAQSAAMEYYETVISEAKNKVMNLVIDLRNTGKVKLSPRKLYKVVGDILLMQIEVTGVLHLLDRPEQIWEDKTMDGLFNDLRAAFDLGERFKALEHKLNLIQSTTEILIETVKDSRLYNADLVIIILIAVEILIFISTLV